MNNIIIIDDCEVIESMSISMDDDMSRLKNSNCDSAY